MPLHHLRSREEPWSRKAVRYDTLNIDVLVFAGAPELQEDEPAGSVICVSPRHDHHGKNQMARNSLHWRIKLNTNDAAVPLDKKSRMWRQDLLPLR